MDVKLTDEQKKLMSIDSLLNLDASKNPASYPPKKKSASSILNNLKGFDQDGPKGSGGFWDSMPSPEFEKKISPQSQIPLPLKKRITMPSIVENLGAPLPTITSLPANYTDRTTPSLPQPEPSQNTGSIKILTKNVTMDPPKTTLRSTKS